MTEQERIDLLKEVARVAPEELNARFYNEDAVRFESELGDWQDITLYAQSGDIDLYDAAGIIVMLDAMEEAGHFPELAPYKSMDADDGMNKIGAGMRRDAGFRYCCCLMDHNVPSPEPWEPLQIFNGNTRAEAVARAFVEVFKSESPNTPTEPKEHQEDDNGKDKS